MKKTLVTLLAIVFVLGITATAFAAPANPFVDVPAKHWAYGAVAKLAKAGIVDGYGDGTFRGDRTMTRYEMAQIVAKAMARSDKADAEMKALIDKLAVEFAAELNNLGVRVAKLEAKTGTIKFGGDARLRWVNTDKAASNPAFQERFRLVGQAQINDNTSFYFRDVVLNHNDFGSYTGNKTNIISDVNVTQKNIMGNVDLTAGRYSLNLGQTTYLAGSTGGFDGVEAKWTEGKGNLRFGYADTGYYNTGNASGLSVFSYAGNIYYGEYNYAFDSRVKANLTYVKNQQRSEIIPQDQIKILGAGLSWKLNDDWTLIGDYWKNTADTAKATNGGAAPKAYVFRLQNGNLKSTVPGSQMFFVEYLKAEYGSVDGNWTGAMVNVINGTTNGLKGYDFQYSLTLAKNVVMDAIYQWDLKDPATGEAGLANGGKTYTRVQINYMF